MLTKISIFVLLALTACGGERTPVHRTDKATRPPAHPAAVRKERVAIDVPPECGEFIPQRAGVDVKPPRVIKRVEPKYPGIAHQRTAGTLIVLDMYVTRTGKVCTVRIVRHGYEPWEAAAVKALRQWEFAPATRNGIAVDCIYTVTVHIDVR